MGAQREATGKPSGLRATPWCLAADRPRHGAHHAHLLGEGGRTGTAPGCLRVSPLTGIQVGGFLLPSLSCLLEFQIRHLCVQTTLGTAPEPDPRPRLTGLSLYLDEKPDVAVLGTNLPHAVTSQGTLSYVSF